MEYDKFGQVFCHSDELVALLYTKPDLDISHYQLIDAESHNSAIQALYLDMPELAQYEMRHDISVEQFDTENQMHWYMPESYKQLDIAKWILEQCTCDAQLQRVGMELLMYQDRDMFDLLRFLKYFVDTMREKKIICGVGRGSSVASYVLYLLGVHRIDSIKYDLPIGEFLK
jgi:DNA polymerase III alpha subunit